MFLNEPLHYSDVPLSLFGVGQERKKWERGKKKKKKRVVESSKGYLALVSKENERTSLH